MIAVGRRIVEHFKLLAHRVDRFLILVVIIMLVIVMAAVDVVIQVTSCFVVGGLVRVFGRALLVVAAGGRAHRAARRCKAIATRFGRICRRHFPMVGYLICAAAVSSA